MDREDAAVEDTERRTCGSADWITPTSVKSVGEFDSEDWRYSSDFHKFVDGDIILFGRVTSD